jgi:hypothetical protein
MMAQTSGGKAAAVLCLALVELYGQDETGMILDELSALLLPQEKRTASMRQLGEVATILGNKLAGVGFWSYLASHVTRIRQAYFTASLDVPKRLLDAPDHATITEFLHCMSKALVEEHSVLYWEGSMGGGYLLSIVIAFCPEDTTVAVENEIIYRGPRRSVIMSISGATDTSFWIESTLYNGVATGKLRHVETAHYPSSSIRFKWEGGLSDALEILALPIFSDTQIAPVRQACVNYIARVLSENGQLPLADRNISR